jgi:hypothetical protein
VGTCSWADESFVKAWYPKGVDRLLYYAQRFDTVEANSTFYRLPDEQLVARWAEKLPDGFVMHVKAFGLMTRHPVKAEALPDDLRAALPVDERGRVDRYVDVKTVNAHRELPLYPRVRRVLAGHKLATAWAADDDPVFAAGRRMPKRYRNVRRALAVAVKHAGIKVAPDERLSSHSLRHTYTSHLIVGLGLDAATTSKLAGHADPSITMRVYADDFRQASERNAAVLARAAERGFGT